MLSFQQNQLLAVLHFVIGTHYVFSSDIWADDQALPQIWSSHVLNVNNNRVEELEFINGEEGNAEIGAFGNRRGNVERFGAGSTFGAGGQEAFGGQERFGTQGGFGGGGFSTGFGSAFRPADQFTGAGGFRDETQVGSGVEAADRADVGTEEAINAGQNFRQQNGVRARVQDSEQAQIQHFLGNDGKSNCTQT